MNATKDFRHTPDIVGFIYEDLFRHLHFELLEGFKVPMFDAFSRVENLLTHLRVNYHQLIGFGKDEDFLMRLISRSLKEEALEWFVSKEIKQWPGWNALVKDFLERFGYKIERIHDQYYLG